MEFEQAQPPLTASSALSPQRTGSQVPDFPSPQRSSSLASFSFTQFFSWHDGAQREQQPCDSSMRKADGDDADRPSAKEDTNAATATAATFSKRDLKLLKLCLTCALCGRLLRHRPATIETCGHCFCYDCINVALEDGCVPLTHVWPWSDLSKEVASAEARWAAAKSNTMMPSSSTGLIVTERDERGVQASGSTPNGLASATVAPTSTLTSAHRSLSTLPALSGRLRKPRRVRQLCPLCLGPAFKWMLATLPALADLCESLHVSYPKLEELLKQLTEGVVEALESRNGGAVTDADLPRPPDAAQGSTDGDTHLKALSSPVRTLSAVDDLGAVASLVYPASSSAGESPRVGEGRGDEEDEEALRRRRRSSGGQRKEITFALDVAVRAMSTAAPQSGKSNSPTAVVASAQLDEDIWGPDPVKEKDEEAKSSKPHDRSAEPSDSGPDNSTVKMSISATAQFSSDLIPRPEDRIISSPILTSAAPQPCSPFDNFRHALELSQLNVKPTHEINILGESPDEDGSKSRDDGGKPDTSAKLSPPPSNAFCLPPAEHARSHNASTGVASLGTDLPETPSTPRAGRPLRVLVDTITRTSESAMRPPLRSIKEASPLAKRPAHFSQRIEAAVEPEPVSPHLAADVSIVWDGGPKPDALACEGLRRLTRKRLVAPRPAYCSVRNPPTGESIQEDGGGRGSLTGVEGSGLGLVESIASMVSVHPSDIWQLETAHVGRHPRVPRCYAILRTGRLCWSSVPGEEMGEEHIKCDVLGENEASQSPIMCVVGNYISVPKDATQNLVTPFVLPALTPVACTALVLRVPCLDCSWCSSSDVSAWRDFAAGGWFSETSAESHHLSQDERYHPAFPKLNAFREALPQLSATLGAAGRNASGGPPIGAWMAETGPLLCAHAHRDVLRTVDPTPRSDVTPAATTKMCDTVPGPPPKGIYLYFVLPDAAIQQLGEICYLHWSHECTLSPQPRGASKAVQLPQSISQRRPRSQSGEESPGDLDWTSADGHPLRSWRRLLLAAGAGVVEVSWTLFQALTNATVAMGKEDAAAGTHRASAASAVLMESLTSLLCSRGGTGEQWVHVDVADTLKSTTPSSTAPSSSLPPRAVVPHTFFLLYSTSVARETFSRLVTQNNALASSGVLDTMKFPLPAQGNRSTARTRACLHHFQAFLYRLAASIACVAAPALPGVDSMGHESFRCEARPASWLLENLAQGRRSAGTNPLASAPVSTVNEFWVDRTKHQAPSLESRLTDYRPADSEATPAPSPESDAAVSLKIDGTCNPPLQRAGVYRSLLYADTP